MGVNYNTRIVTDGLYMNVDAANIKSYPGSGTSVTSTVDSQIGTMTSVGWDGESFSFVRTSGSRIDMNTYYAAEMGVGDVPYSIECVFKIASNPTGVAAGAFTLVGTNSAYGIGLQVEGAPVTLNMGYRSTSNYDDTAHPISIGVWYHAIAVHEPTVVNKIYVNSDLGTTYSASLLTIIAPTGNMSIGSAPGRIGAMDGDISIARLYNKALSADEVKQNFNAIRGRYGI